MSIVTTGSDRTTESLTTSYEHAQQVSSATQTTAVAQTENTTSEGAENEIKVLNKYDRVEISAQGYQKAQDSGAFSSLAGTAEQTGAEKSASAIKTALTTAETDEETNLEQLSEAELKALVADGTITQAQANEELLRRATETSAAEAPEKSGSQPTTDDVE